MKYNDNSRQGEGGEPNMDNPCDGLSLAVSHQQGGSKNVRVLLGSVFLQIYYYVFFMARLVNVSMVASKGHSTLDLPLCPCPPGH